MKSQRKKFPYVNNKINYTKGSYIYNITNLYYIKNRGIKPKLEPKKKETIFQEPTNKTFYEYRSSPFVKSYLFFFRYLITNYS